MSRWSRRNNYSGKSKPRRWVVALTVIAWILGLLIILAGGALWWTLSYFSPERITKLIEKEANEYLDADVRIGSINYKLFSTYPWLQFSVDSISVVSKSLNTLPVDVKERLPQDADFLASIQSISGKINVHSLLHKKINLKDIEVARPRMNIVTVNDTVANFNIFPEMKPTGKLPQIEISGVNVISPVDLTVFSLQNDLNGSLQLENFYVVKDDKTQYNIGFDGLINGRFREYELPQTLPLKFNTGVNLKLPEISILLHNLSFSLAGLAFEARGDINADRHGIDISNAGFNIKIDDIFTLLRYLPQSIEELIPSLEHISGRLPFNLSLEVKSPYLIPTTLPDSLSLAMLPDFEAVVNISDAILRFSPPHEAPVEADDINLDIQCVFNPLDSTAIVNIREMHLNGEGIALSGNAQINGLLADNQSFSGDINFSSPLMKTLSHFLPKSASKINGFLKGKIQFSGVAQNFGKDGVRDIKLDGDFYSHAIRVSPQKGSSMSLTNLKSRMIADIPEYPLKDYSGTKFNFDISADSIGGKYGALGFSLQDFDFNLWALDTVSGAPNPDAIIRMSTGALAVNSDGTRFRARNLDVSAKGALNSTPASTPSAVTADDSGNDALIASRVAHTPLTLVYSGDGGMLQTVMNMMRLNADIKMEEADFKSPYYLYPVDITQLAVSTNLNDVAISAENISGAHTSLSLNAKIEGLQPFLTSYSATPLTFDADIDFSNVDINRLSWGYYGALLKKGENPDSVYYNRPVTPYTSADSVCVMIPANINANLRLKSKSAQYMEYEFSPLSTEIIVNRGAATLKNLTVGTPYCTAVVDWTYSTTNIDNIYMDLAAKVKDFNFTPFYATFPTLSRKAPELLNLTGRLNADILCRFEMFPDMFMNSESLKGNMAMNLSGMEFARQGKIEKITHLLLIEGDQPIKIDNINLTATYHSNLLELNPFNIGFDDYEIRVAGLNNTSGDMYYHVALLKSPFHLPFGVTLKGNFKHPEVRVGGTHINDYNAEQVTSDPSKKINVNIMAWLRNGWNMFIQEAAKYEGKLETNEK